MAFSTLNPENQAKNPNIFDEYAIRQAFHRIFRHGWDFIIKDSPESEWRSVKKYKLTEQKCWYKYTESDTIIGLRFGTETIHGLFDIDWGSKYDPREQEESIRRLKGVLELYGIFCYVLLQSSWSEGLHLYFFLDQPVNTFRLACVMNKAAVEAGLEVKRGQLETFPNTKRYNNMYQGHRLPLQEGSYLLDKDYIPYSERVEDFIDAAAWSAEGNDTELLESRLEESYEWFKKQKNQRRTYQPTAEDQEFLEQVDYAQREIKEGFLNKIRTKVEEGFDDFHETNDLLLTIARLAIYAHGLKGSSLVAYIQETIKSCPGYGKYCRHKHEINRRCEEVARSAEKKWALYRSKMAENRPSYQKIKEALRDKTNLNNERKHNASSRINQAVEHIREQLGELPKKVGECKLLIRNVTKELFGISVSDATLKKPENLPLWHPKYKVKPEPEPTEVEVETVEVEAVEVEAVEVEAVEVEAVEVETVEVEVEAVEVEVEVKEQDTTAVIPVGKTPPSPIPPTNTFEPKIEPVISNVCDVLQQESEKPVIQKKLQEKQLSDEQHKDQSTPCNVIRSQADEQKTPKRRQGIEPKKTVHTLPIMKGVMLHLLLENLYQIFQRAYYNALMRIPRLELVYQGYRGNGANGLIQRKGQKQSLLHSIAPNTEVEILRSDYHSSSFRENPKQLLVYIKPLHHAEDWLGGIAVLVEHLIPIRIRDKISKSTKFRETNQSQDKTLELNDKSNLYPKIPKRGEKSQ